MEKHWFHERCVTRGCLRGGRWPAASSDCGNESRAGVQGRLPGMGSEASRVTGPAGGLALLSRAWLGWNSVTYYWACMLVWF